MDTLILVPDQVRSRLQSIPGFAVGPLPVSFSQNAWPAVSTLLPLADGFTRVGITRSTDWQMVREMILSLTDTEDDCTASIVFSDEPIPSPLLNAIPKELHGLLRRPHPGDLISLGSKLLHTTNSNRTLLEAAITVGFDHRCISGSSTIQRFPTLGPSTPDVAWSVIRPAVDSAVAAIKLSRHDRQCTAAGLLLLWDFLDESHEISQTMEGKGSPRTADYWHGIMHRREPDFGNAVYWFRRVGNHPAFEALGRDLPTFVRQISGTPEQCSIANSQLVKNGVFDPLAMIEAEKQAIHTASWSEEFLCRIVQYVEILNLIAWTTRNQ